MGSHRGFCGQVTVSEAAGKAVSRIADRWHGWREGSSGRPGHSRPTTSGCGVGAGPREKEDATETRSPGTVVVGGMRWARPRPASQPSTRREAAPRREAGPTRDVASEGLGREPEIEAGPRGTEEQRQ